MCGSLPATACRPACAVAEPSEGAGYACDASRGAPGPDGGPRAPVTAPSRPSAFPTCLWRCGTWRGAAVAGAVAAEGLGWLRGTSRPTAGAAREADRIIIHTYIHGRSYKGIGPPRKAETRQTKEQPQSTQVTFNRRRSQISQRIPPQKLPTWAVARYPSAHQPCTHA